MTEIPSPQGYPVILGGDHAAFEIAHAGMDPKARSDWPLPSFDAQDWAEAFCKIAKQHGHDLDEGWMVTWFANALMRGFDEQTARLMPVVGALLAAIIPLADGARRQMLSLRSQAKDAESPLQMSALIKAAERWERQHEAAIAAIDKAGGR